MIEASIPPVMRTATVRRSVEDAFRIFTEEASAWWPLQTHSRAAEGRAPGAVSVVFEPRQGGRVYEVAADGTEGDWARVLVWEPPHRFVLAWKPHSRPTRPTEVEVRFTPDGERTRVDLEHRGWDSQGAGAKEARAGYESGWVKVLDRYRARAGVP